MIHVATVHHKCDRWIAPQLRYLARALGDRPYRVYAFLNGVSDRWNESFHFARTDEPGSHASKLNLLADEIRRSASPDDLMMFLDGDAFPIRDPVPLVESALATGHALVAARRAENAGDVQPHPLFCVIRVKKWEEILGDWSKGPCWRNAEGDLVTDVGGVLWDTLRARGETWLPLLRSNSLDLHPLWFGLYGRVVYHHGAGFRQPHSRNDFYQVIDSLDPVSRQLIGVMRAAARWWDGSGGLNERLRKQLPRRWPPLRRAVHARVAANQALSDAVYDHLLKDPLFFTRFEQGIRSFGQRPKADFFGLKNRDFG